MDIHAEDYYVNYEEQLGTIHFHGTLLLQGPQYAPIVELLDRVVEEAPPQITLNLRQLALLNSSGINTLSKFVIKVRKKQNITMVVQCSSEYSWQDKMLRNLSLLMPGLQLEWD